MQPSVTSPPHRSLPSSTSIRPLQPYPDGSCSTRRSPPHLSPGAPSLVSPIGGTTVTTHTPELVLANAVDPETDPLTYGFRVYDDELLTSLAASVDGVAEGTGETSWTVGVSLPDGPYWWRAYAADAEERGLYAPAGAFVINTQTEVPESEGRLSFSLAPVTPNPFVGSTRVASGIDEMRWRRAIVTPHGPVPDQVRNRRGSTEHGA